MYHHVDVFSDVAYAGNSLAVFVDPPSLTDGQMLRITQELRHFETIFVTASPDSDVVHARVFDLAEELDFAGHPVLGAAGVLHELRAVGPDDEIQWTFVLNARTVRVTTRRRTGRAVSALLDQGRPAVIRERVADGRGVMAALGLDVVDLDDTLPLEVISTGLRYLIVPVRSGALARARIVHRDFTTFLDGVGAQFAYLLDAAAIEGRHWNNDGVIEDIATGSAAGCVAAYLMRHGRARHGEEISLSQGRFAGRPSRIAITAYGTAAAVERVTVGGDVVIVGTGTLRTLPHREPA
jgi:trans-2,3-dihydro-3-hydroxyanthranilate isomerase